MKFHLIVLLVLSSITSSTIIQTCEPQIPSTGSKQSLTLEAWQSIGGHTLLAGAFIFSLPLFTSALYAASGVSIALRSPRFVNPVEEDLARLAGNLGLKIFSLCLAGCAACSFVAYKLIKDDPKTKVAFCLGSSALLQGGLLGTHLLGAILDDKNKKAAIRHFSSNAVKF